MLAKRLIACFDVINGMVTKASQFQNNIDIEKDYDVSIKLSDEQIINCKYQLIRVEKGDSGLYTISGRFTYLSIIDKMTLVQFCMKKDMENFNKSGKDE